MYLPYKHKKLDIDFDHHAILAEVQSLGDDVWTFHGFHGTGHKVLRLYSTNGTLKNQNGKENHSLVPPFLPTDYLERMPYTASVLDAFGVSLAARALQNSRPERSSPPIVICIRTGLTRCAFTFRS